VERTASYLGAARDGTREDLDDLLEHLRPRIVLWSATRLSADLAGRVEADDIAQMVLISVHRDFHRFTGTTRAEFLAWVFAIGENRIRDVVRHFSARKRAPAGQRGALVASLPDELLAGDDRLHAACTTPSQILVREESLQGMRCALDTLKPTYKAVIRMRDLELCSYEKIVEVLGLESIGAARTLHCRALVALRAAMKAQAH